MKHIDVELGASQDMILPAVKENFKEKNVNKKQNDIQEKSTNQRR